MEDLTILKNERIRRGLRQTDFGVPQPHLSLIENRRMFVGQTRGARIARILNMNYQQMFCDDGFARLIVETVD